ncbi:Cationic amino acid transporter 2 [Trichoplax sp. H2]|nr:Cationic amino acid transporter 2 [Trichoplax sp. H2]|eukprot:RDD40516.1 Cationic amino acid transporter 2 [Trichoplax sp. H2]
MAARVSGWVRSFTRLKNVSQENVLKTELQRCLSTFDLVTLGIGGTLGAGVYVVTGQVARNIAGPAVIFSFVIAAITSALAALCYAEFSSRVPRAGSAYTYCYVTVGELPAFIIGWNLILEYLIGTASIARSWSGYLDSIIGGVYIDALKSHFPSMAGSFFAYPDFLAFFITLIAVTIIAIGVQKSSSTNIIFTTINLSVIIFIIVFGLFYVNVDNWLDQNGGFFPYGGGGVLAGAATCFYSFVGFDIIATTGEEADNPKKSIPAAIIISLAICCVAYIAISIVMTLIVPYYMLNENAALSVMFEQVGVPFVKYIVSIGAISGLSASLMGCIFPLPRIVYAMANDGLIFQFLARIHPKTKTPLVAVYLFGLIAALLAMLFSIEHLVEMMSIGTLLAYMLVSCCVLILRYRPDDQQHGMESSTTGEQRQFNDGDKNNFSNKPTEELSQLNRSDDQSNSAPLSDSNRWQQCVSYCRQFLTSQRSSSVPTVQTSRAVTTATMLIIVFSFCLFAVLIHGYQELRNGNGWLILLVIIFTVIVIFAILGVAFQPQSHVVIPFKAPLLPFMPILSIMANIYLMLMLQPVTWIRFVIWLAIGFAIYFFYGINHSRAQDDPSYEQLPQSAQALLSATSDED